MNSIYSRLLPLVVSALLTALAGCNSTPVLRATFESDHVGRLPSLDLAGDPSGDMLWTTAGSAETLSVVSDPVIGSKSVQLTNSGSLVRMLGFVPVELSSSADTVYAYWTGVPRGGAAPLSVSLMAEHFETIGGVRFEDGQVFARTPTGSEAIGSYENDVSHVVILTHHREAGLFDIVIIGRSRASRSGIPVINATVAESRRPFLLIDFGDGSPDAQYVMDSVFISEKEPEM